jgi:hypothetical protein
MAENHDKKMGGGRGMRLPRIYLYQNENIISEISMSSLAWTSYEMKQYST